MKKFIFLALCTLLYVNVSTAQEAATVSSDNPAVAEAPKEDEELVSHKVMRGETIMMIAKKYKVKPKDIYEYNPDATQGIAANLSLQIPMHRALKTKKVPGKQHINQPDGPLYTTSATAEAPKD